MHFVILLPNPTIINFSSISYINWNSLWKHFKFLDVEVSNITYSSPTTGHLKKYFLRNIGHCANSTVKLWQGIHINLVLFEYLVNDQSSLGFLNPILVGNMTIVLINIFIGIFSKLKFQIMWYRGCQTFYFVEHKSILIVLCRPPVFLICLFRKCYLLTVLPTHFQLYRKTKHMLSFIRLYNTLRNV